MEHFFSPNSGEDQKKVFIKNKTLFSPNSSEDQKKKRFSTRIEHFFTEIYAQMYTHSNSWGDAAKLLEGIYPPLFRHPCPKLPLPLRHFQDGGFFIGDQQRIRRTLDQVAAMTFFLRSTES